MVGSQEPGARRQSGKGGSEGGKRNSQSRQRRSAEWSGVWSVSDLSGCVGSGATLRACELCLVPWGRRDFLFDGRRAGVADGWIELSICMPWAKGLAWWCGLWWVAVAWTQTWIIVGSREGRGGDDVQGGVSEPCNAGWKVEVRYCSGVGMGE